MLPEGDRGSIKAAVATLQKRFKPAHIEELRGHRTQGDETIEQLEISIQQLRSLTRVASTKISLSNGRESLVCLISSMNCIMERECWSNTKCSMLSLLLLIRS